MEAVTNAVVIAANRPTTIRPKRDRSNRDRPRPQLLTRDELDARCNAVKVFDKIIADVVADLGGRDQLSSLELSLVESFAACHIQIEALNCRVLVGETISLADLCTLISTQTRVASRLGLSRRPRDVSTPSLSAYLAAAETKPNDGEATA
jgi:hypothetical protein